MIRHIFPDFLRDNRVYGRTEGYWVELWRQVNPDFQAQFGWQQPWFQPLPRLLSEGNPIFSAVSPTLRRGIRIIQFEPTSPRAEIVAYPDTFGGPYYDPSAIRELVISCALSDVTSQMALSLMQPWIVGKSVSFNLGEAGMVMTPARYEERTFGDDIAA